MVRRKLLEIIIILVLVLAGLLSIYHSSKISEFIPPEIYWFSFDSQSEGKINLSVFNLTYDFTKGEGTISFFPSNNTLIELRVKFPSFISNKTTDINFFRCKNYADSCRVSTDIKFNKEFEKIPPDSTYSTKIKLYNFSRGFYPYEKVIIKFKSDIKPSGTFIILQSNTDIKDANYGLNFILGDDFEYTGMELIQGVKLYDIGGFNERDIKLEFEGDFHSFRIKTTDRNNIFLGTIFLGVGASLIGSAIVLLSQFILGLFYKRETEKLNKLSKVLNGQIKIKGVGEKTLDKIKNYLK
nr:hypothetical protein [Candidatus Woesearchaeota archaeon]